MFILTVMYNFVIFEALGYDVSATFYLGYFVIGIVSVHIIINILLILR